MHDASFETTARRRHGHVPRPYHTARVVPLKFATGKIKLILPNPANDKEGHCVVLSSPFFAWPALVHFGGAGLGTRLDRLVIGCNKLDMVIATCEESWIVYCVCTRAWSWLDLEGLCRAHKLATSFNPARTVGRTAAIMIALHQSHTVTVHASRLQTDVERGLPHPRKPSLG